MRLTDLCNRHSNRAPENRSTPEPAACAAATTSAMSSEREPRSHPDSGVGPPCGNPAPGRAALDGASPASDEWPAFLHSFIEEETSTARERRFPAAAFSAARRTGDSASDAPCRAPCPPVEGRPPSARIASTALASTRTAFPIRGAFHRQVLSFTARVIARVAACVTVRVTARAERARHRTHSFAAVGRLPTLFHSSICSRTEELDPRRW